MSSQRTYHRLKEVRQAAEISLRTLAKRMGMPVSVLQQQEATADLNLSDLFRWRDALGVPINELLVDPPDALAETSRQRAGLVQAMRSVRSLQQTELDEQQQATVRNLEVKLLEIMPELESVRAWPIYGEKRNPSMPARIEAQMIATAIWCPEAHQET